VSGLLRFGLAAGVRAAGVGDDGNARALAKTASVALITFARESQTPFPSILPRVISFSLSLSLSLSLRHADSSGRRGAGRGGGEGGGGGGGGRRLHSALGPARIPRRRATIGRRGRHGS